MHIFPFYCKCDVFFSALFQEVKGKWKKAEAELRRVHRVGQVKFGRVRDVLPAADSHIIRVESDSVFGAK